MRNCLTYGQHTLIGFYIETISPLSDSEKSSELQCKHMLSVSSISLMHADKKQPQKTRLLTISENSHQLVSTGSVTSCSGVVSGWMDTNHVGSRTHPDLWSPDGTLKTNIWMAHELLEAELTIMLNVPIFMVVSSIGLVGDSIRHDWCYN